MSLSTLWNGLNPILRNVIAGAFATSMLALFATFGISIYNGSGEAPQSTKINQSRAERILGVSESIAETYDSVEEVFIVIIDELERNNPGFETIGEIRDELFRCSGRMRAMKRELERIASEMDR